jgi:hypothetical protein
MSFLTDSTRKKALCVQCRSNARVGVVRKVRKVEVALSNAVRAGSLFRKTRLRSLLEDFRLSIEPCLRSFAKKEHIYQAMLPPNITASPAQCIAA